RIEDGDLRSSILDLRMHSATWRKQHLNLRPSNIQSIAGGERQGGGGGQQVSAALDVGGPGAGQVALGRQQIDHRRQTCRAIRLERRVVRLLGSSEQRKCVVVLT